MKRREFLKSSIRLLSGVIALGEIQPVTLENAIGEIPPNPISVTEEDILLPPPMTVNPEGCQLEFIQSVLFPRQVPELTEITHTTGGISVSGNGTLRDIWTGKTKVLTVEDYSKFSHPSNLMPKIVGTPAELQTLGD